MRRFAAATACLWLLLAAAVTEAANIAVPSVWRFRLDPGAVGVKQQWQSAEWPKDAKSIKVGSAWEPQGYAYDGCAWYRTKLDVPNSLTGRRVTVQFGGVDEEAWVYWNGRFAGCHSGWASAFEFDVSPYVKPGANTLVVRVRDSLLMGGIYKPVTVAVAEPTAEPEFVQRWRKEGVRLVQLAGAEGSEKVMAKAGCNSILLQTWSLSNVKKTSARDSDQIVTDSDLTRLKAMLDAQAVKCKDSNLIDLCNFYGLSEPELAMLQQHDYDRCVDAAGNTSTISSCPLSRRYWFGMILPQLLTQAKALAESGVPGGALVDLEFYAAETIFPWWDWDVCYCSNCWGVYCADTDQPPSITRLPTSKRGASIKSASLKKEYEDVMSRRVTAVMREIAAECRKVKPDFILGFYPYVVSWFGDAVLRGWSTPSLPALVVSENEFVQGYNERTVDRMNHLKAQGINGLYVGGIFQGSCYPDSYAAKAEELVRRADGYWLYYAAMFFVPEAENKLVPPDKGTEYTLSTKASEYFEALTKANNRLDTGRTAGAVFPAHIDLLPRLRPVVTHSMPVLPSLKSQFEIGADGWTSIYPMPAVDSRIAHSGRSSLRFDPVDGPIRGMRNVTRSITLNGDTEYAFRAWVRVTGVTEGQGLGLLAFPSDQEMALGNYVSLRNLPDGEWTRMEQRFRTPKNVGTCLLSIHPACPEAILWVDDVEVVPISVRKWVSDPLEVPSGLKCGRLMWEGAPTDGKLTVSVYDSATNEKLQWMERSGNPLSRLDSLSNRRFTFEVIYEGSGWSSASPLKKLWLEVSDKQ